MKQAYLLFYQLSLFRQLLWSISVFCLLSSQSFAATILQYHHVSDTTPSVTSITPETFGQHLHYLKTHDFQVVPLEQMINAVRQQQPMTDKMVAITFDDGYISVYQNARPLLKQYDWPYTLFVNPKYIDDGYAQHISWSQLRELSQEKATIANHTMLHDYLARPPPQFSAEQWLNRIEQDILSAEQRISKETGQQHKMLAYPYGEFTVSIVNLLKKNGFVGFGQHSGAVGKYTDLTRIPRFPASGVYANLDTLSIKLNSLNLPIIALENADPVFQTNPPLLTLTVNTDDFDPVNMQCYIDQHRAVVNWLTNLQFTVVAGQKLPQQRSRYNCTAASLKHKGRYYWFSQPWINLLND